MAKHLHHHPLVAHGVVQDHQVYAAGIEHRTGQLLTAAPLGLCDPIRFRVAKGTLERIDAALTAGESRTGFIRQAVERELERREQGHDPRQKGPHAGN